MQEQEHLKRCIYRQWYRQRNERTSLNDKKTFNDLFAAKYGETMDEYHARLAAESKQGQKHDEQVAKFEATMNFYMKAGR